MKILVVSLLRGGDLLMQAPLFESLSEKHPSAELHILINDEVSWIQEVLPCCIDQVHIFPRKSLQRLMGEADHHLMRALSELDQIFLDLNESNFELVLNMTHTRLSAYLCEQIQAPKKMGLVSEGVRFRGLDNPWIKHFNDRFSGANDCRFHYTEILGRSLDLKALPKREPKTDRIQRIFIQALTSDEKKNWDLMSLRHFLELSKAEWPQIEIAVLCSKAEFDFVSRYIHPEDLRTWKFLELSQKLGPRDLVISGDTALMHLAVQKNCQILEVALGPSNPAKTGPFGVGNYVVSSRLDCAPCSHSKTCSQVSRLCGEYLLPEDLLSLVRSILDGTEMKISKNFRVQRTAYSPQVGWYLEDLMKVSDSAQVFSDTDLFAQMNKLLWQMVFDPKWKLDEDFVIQKFSGISDELKNQNQAAALVLSDLQINFEDLIHRLSQNILENRDIYKARLEIERILHVQPVDEWTRGFKDIVNFHFASPIHFLSAYQDRLEEFKQVLYHRDQILRILKGEPRESGYRKIPTDRSAEA